MTDLIDAMQLDADRPLNVLKVDGGAAANDLLMQFQADVLQTTLSRPVNLETTAIGAAFLAGLGVGIWKDTDAIRLAWQEERRFEPTLGADAVKSIRRRWHEAVAKA